MVQVEREARTNENEAQKLKRLRKRRNYYYKQPDHYISYMKEWKESDTVQTRNDLNWLNKWLQLSLEEMETTLSVRFWQI